MRVSIRIRAGFCHRATRTDLSAGKTFYGFLTARLFVDGDSTATSAMNGVLCVVLSGVWR